MGQSNMVDPISSDGQVLGTAAEQQIERITEAFSYEMTARYWNPGFMTAEEFRDCVLNDIQRLVTIIRAVR